MKICIMKIKDIDKLQIKVFKTLEESKQYFEKEILSSNNEKSWDIKIDTDNEYYAENLKNFTQVSIKELDADNESYAEYFKNLTQVSIKETESESANKLSELIEMQKALFEPALERLDTFRTIEYVLDKCTEDQLSTVRDCLLKHFEQICEDYEKAIRNVKEQKRNCTLRVQEKSIYLYNVLISIIGKEMGRQC